MIAEISVFSLSFFLNTDSDEADVMSSGRLFQSFGPAEANERSPDSCETRRADVKLAALDLVRQHTWGHSVFLGAGTPLSQWGRVPVPVPASPRIFETSYTCAHIVWETTSKLHGDQITREEYYYTFDHECWLLFMVTNFLVKNNLVSHIRHITAHVQWPEYWKTAIKKHLGAGIYANSGSVARLATRSACAVW